jgi:hypothetical protein
MGLALPTPATVFWILKIWMKRIAQLVYLVTKVVEDQYFRDEMARLIQPQTLGLGIPSPRKSSAGS